jgi:large subunit ribosomal protein L25
MAQRQSIQATPRTIIGKDTKKLRRVGEVPGVVYGPVITEPISVTVNMRELDRMYTSYGSTMLVDVKVDGTSYTTYMRHMQIDRMKKQPIHIEFFAPNMRVAMSAKVPVIIVGEPANDDGVITLGDGTIELRGLPDALPAAIEVDVSVLAEIDQAIHVRDLTFAEGVEVVGDPEEMVVKLSAPTLPELEETLEISEAEADEAELETAAEAGGSENTGGSDETPAS